MCIDPRWLRLQTHAERVQVSMVFRHKGEIIGDAEQRHGYLLVRLARYPCQQASNRSKGFLSER